MKTRCGRRSKSATKIFAWAIALLRRTSWAFKLQWWPQFSLASVLTHSASHRFTHFLSIKTRRRTHGSVHRVWLATLHLCADHGTEFNPGIQRTQLWVGCINMHRLRLMDLLFVSQCHKMALWRALCATISTLSNRPFPFLKRVRWVSNCSRPLWFCNAWQAPNLLYLIQSLTSKESQRKRNVRPQYSTSVIDGISKNPLRAKSTMNCFSKPLAFTCQSRRSSKSFELLMISRKITKFSLCSLQYQPSTKIQISKHRFMITISSSLQMR